MLILCLLQPATMALAQTEAERDQYAAIEIIRVQHRDAILIRTAVMPELHSRGSIGRIDNNLIIASTRANLRELRTLIQQLDQPRQSLLISVDFDFNNSEVANVQSVQILDGDTLIIREQQPVLNANPLDETDTENGIDRAADRVAGDSASAADSSTDSAAGPNRGAMMALSTRAEIRGSQVYITLHNVTSADDQAADNRTVTRSLSVTPGQWTVVNPAESVLPLLDNDTAGTAGISTAIPAGLRQIAVRVELLP